MCAGSGGSGDDDGSQSAAMGPERWKLYAALVAVATVAATALTYGGDSIQVQHMCWDCIGPQRHQCSDRRQH